MIRSLKIATSDVPNLIIQRDLDVLHPHGVRVGPAFDHLSKQSSSSIDTIETDSVTCCMKTTNVNVSARKLDSEQEMTRYCSGEKIELTANQFLNFQNEHWAYEVRLHVGPFW